jgi:endoglucanase
MQFLKLNQNQILNSEGQEIFLRGVCIGAWMNMEGFLNGYPGSEYSMRRVMASELGKEKAEFFFDRWLDHIFDEADARFLSDCGMTVVRLPLNYRHFEDDLAPFEYSEKGFQRLDKALDWCEKYGIYAILDLHSAPGWQSGDWHCDNSSRHALFWGHRHFQDRFVALWEAFAQRYRSRSVVAAYNLLNEPVTNAPNGRFVPDASYQPDWDSLNALYRRTVHAIRKIDPEHIIFLEGDYLSTRFSCLDSPYDDQVAYSSHNYINATFADVPYPEKSAGSFHDREALKRNFLATEGYRFTQKHNRPLWVGEFGVGGNYPHPSFPHRVAALDDQLSIYNELGIHWTSWSYKSCGLMSWVQTQPDSLYNQTIQPVLAAKAVLNPDVGWLAGFDEPLESALTTIEDQIMHYIPGLDEHTNRQFFRQAATATYTADLMQPLFANQFKCKTETEIDNILSSFAIENCIQREEMIAVYQKHLKVPVSPSP